MSQLTISYLSMRPHRRYAFRPEGPPTPPPPSGLLLQTPNTQYGEKPRHLHPISIVKEKGDAASVKSGGSCVELPELRPKRW